MEKAKKIALIIVETMVVSAITLFLIGISIGILAGAGIAASYASIVRKLQDEHEIGYLAYWKTLKRLIIQVTPVWIPIYLFLIIFSISVLNVSNIGPMWPYWLGLQLVVLSLFTIFVAYLLALMGRYTMLRKEALIVAYTLTFKYLYYNWLMIAVGVLSSVIILRVLNGSLVILVLMINLYFGAIITQASFIKSKLDQTFKCFDYSDIKIQHDK